MSPLLVRPQRRRIGVADMRSQEEGTRRKERWGGEKTKEKLGQVFQTLPERAPEPEKTHPSLCSGIWQGFRLVLYQKKARHKLSFTKKGRRCQDTGQRQSTDFRVRQTWVQWTWTWANSRRWWRTRKLSMLQSGGSQSQPWFSNWTTTDLSSLLTSGTWPRYLFMWIRS